MGGYVLATELSRDMGGYVLATELSRDMGGYVLADFHLQLHGWLVIIPTRYTSEFTGKLALPLFSMDCSTEIIQPMTHHCYLYATKLHFKNN